MTKTVEGTRPHGVLLLITRSGIHQTETEEATRRESEQHVLYTLPYKISLLGESDVDSTRKSSTMYPLGVAPLIL